MSWLKKADEFTKRQGIVSAEWCLILDGIEQELSSLRKELAQQRFNNEHNLSIDQKVADRITELEQVIVEMAEALNKYLAIDIGHYEDCIYYGSDDDECNCGTLSIESFAGNVLDKHKSIIKEARGKK